MSEDCLAIGDKLHVITRRMFDTDLRRHFVGQCTRVSENFARVEGYAFVFDASRNEYEKRPERRTRVFSLVGAGLIITILPEQIDLDRVKYQMSQGRLVLTDFSAFELDINEFGAKN